MDEPTIQVTLTRSQAALVKQALMTVPIQGRFMDLGEAMRSVANLILKFEFPPEVEPTPIDEAKE